MKKINGVVIVKEIMTNGYQDEKGKVIATQTEKFSSKPIAVANEYVANDPTAEIFGDAYEVFDLFQGRKRRNVVSEEVAIEIESKISIKSITESEGEFESEGESEISERKKPGRKPKQTEEKETSKEEEIENISNKT